MDKRKKKKKQTKARKKETNKNIKFMNECVKKYSNDFPLNIINNTLKLDKIEIEIESAGDSFLVIGYTWSPYWVASIDGIEQKIIRANYAQLGLPLSKGRHNVVLRFNSFSSKFPK